MTAVVAPPAPRGGVPETEDASAVTLTAPSSARAAHGRRPGWRPLLTGVVVVVGIEVALVTPTLSAAVTRLSGADPWWVLVALGAAAVSMGFFARTRRRLLAAAGVRVRQRDALAAVYVANALHVTLPGGAAFSTAWTYRWMRARGAGGPAVTWTLLAGGLLSGATLAALGLTGSLLAGRERGIGSLSVDATVIGLLIVALAVVRRQPGLLVAAARRAAAAVDRVLHRWPGRSVHAVDGLVAQVAAVRPRGADWLTAGAFALANWIFDAGCLAASAAALGLHGLPVSLLLLTYTAGMATSSLSLLPAGIGLVDGAMVLALAAGGVPAATAVPVVLLYRLISVGAVVAAGWCVVALQSLLARGELPACERAAGPRAADGRATMSAGPLRPRSTPAPAACGEPPAAAPGPPR